MKVYQEKAIAIKSAVPVQTFIFYTVGCWDISRVCILNSLFKAQSLIQPVVQGPTLPVKKNFTNSWVGLQLPTMAFLAGVALSWSQAKLLEEYLQLLGSIYLSGCKYILVFT